MSAATNQYPSSCEHKQTRPGRTACTLQSLAIDYLYHSSAGESIGGGPGGGSAWGIDDWSSGGCHGDAPIPRAATNQP